MTSNNDNKQWIIALDGEGVLIPEVWIHIANKTGIEELKVTTLTEPDFDLLMNTRIKILNDNNIGLAQLLPLIEDLKMLDGAIDFLNTLRASCQVIILSDMVQQLFTPFVDKYNLPTIFCNSLTSSDGEIGSYKSRIDNPKSKAVKAFRDLNYNVLACGDSYNDISMLGDADIGYLFNSPDNIVQEFPQFEHFDNYNKLLEQISNNIK